MVYQKVCFCFYHICCITLKTILVRCFNRSFASNGYERLTYAFTIFGTQLLTSVTSELTKMFNIGSQSHFISNKNSINAFWRDECNLLIEVIIKLVSDNSTDKLRLMALKLPTPNWFFKSMPNSLRTCCLCSSWISWSARELKWQIICFWLIYSLNRASRL